MSWVDQSSIFGYQSYLTAIQMQNLRDNLTAIANGDTGAPWFQNSAYTTLMFGDSQIANEVRNRAVTSGELHDHTVGNGAQINSNGIQDENVRWSRFSNTFGNTGTRYINPNGWWCPDRGWMAWAVQSGQSFSEYVYGTIKWPTITGLEMYLDGLTGLSIGGGLMFFTGSDNMEMRIYNDDSNTATLFYRYYFQ